MAWDPGPGAVPPRLGFTSRKRLGTVMERKLTPEEINRYSRHLVLPQVGVVGQEKFKAAKVLLIGCGGLGSPLGLYLAAAGVGTLGIIDH
ncbi:MAG: ThiF family adenylyltransferase, partial [SAR324 cluster bacterium]|nr:ThiF family adenylyltransferase [SAR324 cluster bacterium]